MRALAWVFCLVSLMVLVFPAALPAAPDSGGRLRPDDVKKATALAAREKEIAAREKALADKERELNLLQKDVDAKLEKLTALQREVTAKLAELNAVPDKEFKNLIKIYSAMKASKVAPLLNKMPVDDAVRILRAMKTPAVAKIIPKLDAALAVEVSRRLGMLNAL